MPEKWHMRLLKFLNRRKQINVMRVSVAAFAGIILLGMLLLLLPCASRSGQSCGWETALFTATSASCVTGLILADTWVQWSGFGQTVILLLIQIGGLGFMSCVCVVLFVRRRRMGMRQRLVLAQSLNLESYDGLLPMMRRALLRTLVFEGCGAGILTARLSLDFPFPQALARGLFHAVSAFCNAGFDLMGIWVPYGSMGAYATDPVVMLTLTALIILGGLGFFVWDDIARARRFSRLSVYSRLVLISTAVLVLGGALAVLTLEWNNPATLGPMNPAQKLLAALFQSTTWRTAGFTAVDQAALTGATKLLGCLLMLVGGSSGSTAGGIKTGTVALLFLAAWAALRGKTRVVLWGRRIPAEQIFSALGVAMIAGTLAVAGGMALSLMNGLPLLDCLYEAASAIATVGITVGITPALSTASHLLLICFMFFGRVGVMTIGLALLLRETADGRIGYPETRIMIG